MLVYPRGDIDPVEEAARPAVNHMPPFVPDRKLLLLLMIGVFMGALDLTILAPALPAIAESYEVTPAGVVLAFSIYAAFYAASVPLMGKLSDVKGYRPVYGWSMLLFSVGSLAAAMAPSLPLLVLARLLQGAGGGGLFPVAQAIASVAYPQEKQGRVFAILLGVFALGGVMGPNVGGFLVQSLSWRWIFWINVPLGVLGILLLPALAMPHRPRRGRIDWPGVGLVGWTFGALVLGIESLRHIPEYGLFSVRVAGLLVAALAGAVMLVLVERRVHEPILDVRLIATSTMLPALAVSFLIGYALLSAVVLTPLYVQIRFAASSLGSGAVLNAAAVGLLVSAWIAGAFTNLVGARLLVILGMLSTTVGIGIMVGLSYSLLGILSGLIFLGLGLGLSQGPLSQLALSLAPDDHEGQVAGLVSISRSMGGATGITTAGVLLSGAARRIAFLPEAEALQELNVEDWGTAGSLQVLQQAPEPVQDVVRVVLAHGILNGWYWAAGAAAIGLFAAVKLRSVRPQAWH